MREVFSRKVENGRIKTGKFATEPDASFGRFSLWHGNRVLFCIVSDDQSWEHVSVSVSGSRRKKKGSVRKQPLPTWEDMAFIKDLFWEEEETVAQIHPPHSQYIDNAQVLHLWKPTGVKLPLPPQILVGLPGVSQGDLKMISARMEKR